MSKGIVALLMLLMSTSLSSHNLVEHLYTTLLGNENASCTYRVLLVQALKDNGVANPHTIPIKKMNILGPRLVGADQLLSFTAFGIWINEDLLNELDDAQLYFILYHEAAHYAKEHHKQLLLKVLPVPFAAGALITASYLLIDDTWMYRTTVASILALTCAGAFSCIVQPTVLQQEKDADLIATQVLITKGNGATVKAYIDTLAKFLEGKTHVMHDAWHACLHEQLEYLQTEYKKHIK